MSVNPLTKDEEALNEVRAELFTARAKFGDLASHHEAYAVILEELDEYWEIVRLKLELRSNDAMRTELRQIAAMAICAMTDLDPLRRSE